ncbi:MAG: DNA polymerase III subunit delta [Candidatus Spyradosoma sp.]
MSSHFVLVVGDDDFLVDREARMRFERLSADAADEMSREIIDGAATKAAEVESVMSAFLSATRTVSLFGGKKYVWLRNVNWFADGVVRVKAADPAGTPDVPAKKGRGARTAAKKDILEDSADKIAEEFSASDPSALCVVVSLVRPDKRRTPVKKLLKVGEVVSVASMSDSEEMLLAVEKAARELGVTIGEDAARLLVGKVNGHMRMTFAELEKLACYVGPGGEIDAETVSALVPVFGAGDFFEPSEYFFAGDLAGTLESLRRFFFNNTSARPLLAAMQNRNRLLIQLRALVDAGDATPNFRGGISKSAIESASARYGRFFGGNDEKSSLNLFSQNAWYVGEKLAGATLRDKSVTLRRLIDRQLEFVRAFEELVARPGEDEAVMRELAARCLSAGR